MIIYSKTLQGFQDDCFAGKLIDTLDANIQNCYHGSSGGEIRAWKNSLSYMDRIIQHTDLPKDAGVAIEYMIPTTSKRIDFLLSGYDKEKKPTVVIIELKQWDSAEAVPDQENIVRTYVGHGNRFVPHPSYQAWSYAELIRNFNEAAQEGEIQLYPCAYLHNYIIKEKGKEPLLEPGYQEILEQSPLFGTRDNQALVDFLNGHIQKGDNRSVLFEIENGRIRPSKSLQDQLASMLEGNREFTLIDDQKIVYEKALALAEKTKCDGKKRILIVEGGPGTGKSVISVNLLVELIRRNSVTNYVTKNSAPREVYKRKLKGKYKKAYIDNLFRSAGSFHNREKNSIDALIVDEAHRLSQFTSQYSREDTQVQDIIRAAKFAVFFVDDHQRVTTNDLGSKEVLLNEAKAHGAIVETDALRSQFRCNGSDGYLAWLDDVLGIRETANKLFDLDYDFDVVEDPNEMLDWVKAHNQDNKARVIAGYCWRWPMEHRSNADYPDITLPEYDFQMSWNLNRGLWAIDPHSVEEAGCIHTAQGLEFDYVGILIGHDLFYKDGKVQTDFFARAVTDQSIKGLKKLSKTDPEKAHQIGDDIIRNTYRTLLTRGLKGCRVFCTDKALSEYLKKRRWQGNLQYEYAEDREQTAAENVMPYGE